MVQVFIDGRNDNPVGFTAAFLPAMILKFPGRQYERVRMGPWKFPDLDTGDGFQDFVFTWKEIKLSRIVVLHESLWTYALLPRIRDLDCLLGQKRI